MKSYDQFIAGNWFQSLSGERIESIDPATGSPWCTIARGDADDVDAAVSAARNAMSHALWKSARVADRANVLFEIADLLSDNWETLVEAEIRDNGKRIAEVRGQFSGLDQWYRHFAGEIEKFTPVEIDNAFPGADATLYHEPYGVVAAITPWNSPLMILAWKLAPALAAGNAVVVKPSEHASASTLEFANLVGRKIPPGLLNVVTGFGHEVGEALVRHPEVSRVTFTGSDVGGRKVGAAAGAGIKPVTLELGGKSPQIVFADADLDNAVNGIVSGIFLSNGQTCIAGSRLIVEARVHDTVVEKLMDRARSLRPGAPLNPETEIAPLANAPHLEKVLAMIAEAKAEGADCVCGGKRIDHDELARGFYVEPTIFTGVTRDTSIWKDEVFGPVLAVARFESEEEALSLANDTRYGLAAGIWTTDTARADRLSREIAAGTIYVNHYRSVSPHCPIGGYKQSGYGRELGPDAIKDFMRTKAVWKGHAPCADPFPAPLP